MGIWDGFAGGIASGGLGLVGGLVGGHMEQSAASKSAEMSMAMNEQNLKFQREMAQNAHQYEVKDLLAAGLNPILSANKGASASGGSQIPIPQLKSGFNASTAVEVARVAQDIGESMARIELTKEKTATEKGTPANVTGHAIEYGKEKFKELQNRISQRSEPNSAKTQSNQSDFRFENPKEPLFGPTIHNAKKANDLKKSSASKESEVEDIVDGALRKMRMSPASKEDIKKTYKNDWHR